MNRNGLIALEALIASAQVLLLAIVVTCLLLCFWQTWSECNQASRQRQWSTLTFAYLDQDFQAAEKVQITAAWFKITTPEGEYIYQLTEEGSFYRGRGSAFYALAKVEAVRWWRQAGGLLWIELVFPLGNYRMCYSLAGLE